MLIIDLVLLIFIRLFGILHAMVSAFCSFNPMQNLMYICGPGDIFHFKHFLKMTKRILIISLVAVALALSAIGYFILQRSMIVSADPFGAVPGDAVVIGRTINLGDFISSARAEKDMWRELETVLNSSKLTGGIGFLDSLLRENPSASVLTAGKRLFFSVHPAGRDNYETIYYLEIASSGEARAFTQIMYQLLEGQSPVSERVYNRARIYDASFRWDDDAVNLSWTTNGGVFILSISPLLIENAVDQLYSGNAVTEDEAFMKVHGTAGREVDANIYLNLKHFPGYISTFTEGKSKNLLSGFTELGNWAELDLHIREGAFMLNGFSFSEQDKHNYLNVFDGQSPVTLNAESVIPGYSSAFMGLGLSDMQLFQQNYTGWLEKTDQMGEYENMHEEFLRLTGEKPADIFHSFMEGEIAMVMTGWDNPGVKGESFLVIKTRSRSLAMEAMQGMLRHNAALTDRDADSYKEIYQVDREISWDIYNWPFINTGEVLFGRIFGVAETSWFTFVDNYLVFGESSRGLSEFIHANVLNQTIDADLRFREFSEFLVSRNNFYFYSNVTRSAGIFTSIFNEQLSGNLTNNLESFLKFQAMALQFSSGREMIYNNLFLRYSPQIIEEPHTEWQTRLDTLINFKPLLLTNHNTGDNEIFVQDLNNTIYLINNAGRILWKKPLPGKIMGNVYQIDYFNNNRLQMLFNTREHIYLLDRNGNDVGRYPIRLPSPATNGISLFDYENNKDYRIFVACEDRSVVARTKEGNIVTGWTFRETEHNVYNEIRHFRVGGRDHIVFADNHRVYIADRQGNIRVRPDRVFPVSSQNNIIYEGRTPESDPRLTLTDTLGLVWHIYFDGRTETKKTGEYTRHHFFDFQDVDADGYRNYIFIDNNRLDVYRRDGSLMFGHDFPVAVDAPPAYYYFSGDDRKVGVVSRDAGQIYLFNSSGDLYQGFPLHGRSLFTIGFLNQGHGQFHLIVGSEYNFLYNYIVY